jgi:hypothetical protein
MFKEPAGTGNVIMISAVSPCVKADTHRSSRSAAAEWVITSLLITSSNITPSVAAEALARRSVGVSVELSACDNVAGWNVTAGEGPRADKDHGPPRCGDDDLVSEQDSSGYPSADKPEAFSADGTLLGNSCLRTHARSHSRRMSFVVVAEQSVDPVH